MNTTDINQAVEERAENGFLECHDARALAEQLDVPYSQVGQACNELNVKIFACELGCF